MQCTWLAKTIAKTIWLLVSFTSTLNVCPPVISQQLVLLWRFETNLYIVLGTPWTTTVEWLRIGASDRKRQQQGIYRKPAFAAMDRKYHYKLWGVGGWDGNLRGKAQAVFGRRFTVVAVQTLSGFTSTNRVICTAGKAVPYKHVPTNNVPRSTIMWLVHVTTKHLTKQ